MNKKNIIISVLAIAILTTLLFGFTSKNGSEKGILTMRVTESIATRMDNSINIIYEDGKTEKIELKNLTWGDYSLNLLTINKTLNSIVTNGYHLISTAGGESESSVITTYTFEKE